MADIPKLTDVQAAFVRAASFLRDEVDCDSMVAAMDGSGLTRWGSDPSVGPCLTDLGRAALAAYDAEQRRRIVVETMRECEAAVGARLVLLVGGLRLLNDATGAIRALIAKEEASDG